MDHRVLLERLQLAELAAGRSIFSQDLPSVLSGCSAEFGRTHPMVHPCTPSALRVCVCVQSACGWWMFSGTHAGCVLPCAIVRIGLAWPGRGTRAQPTLRSLHYALQRALCWHAAQLAHATQQQLDPSLLACFQWAAGLQHGFVRSLLAHAMGDGASCGGGTDAGGGVT